MPGVGFIWQALNMCVARVGESFQAFLGCLPQLILPCPLRLNSCYFHRGITSPSERCQSTRLLGCTATHLSLQANRDQDDEVQRRAFA